jgi:hypothetical protein
MFPSDILSRTLCLNIEGVHSPESPPSRRRLCSGKPQKQFDPCLLCFWEVNSLITKPVQQSLSRKIFIAHRCRPFMNREVNYRLDNRPYPESRKNKYFNISSIYSYRYETCAFSHTSPKHRILPHEYLTDYLINCWVGFTRTICFVTSLCSMKI